MTQSTGQHQKDESDATQPIRIEGDPPIRFHEILASTNTEAMRLGETGADHLTAIVTRFQTAGRGKLDAKWFMPAGEGALLSVLMRRMPPGIEFATLTLRSGWVLAQMLSRTTGAKVDVKKPNDLMIDGKKLGGILSEARWRGEEMLFAVIGVGINVNVSEFPADLRDRSTSLAIETGREHDVEAVSLDVIECLRTM